MNWIKIQCVSILTAGEATAVKPNKQPNNQQLDKSGRASRHSISACSVHTRQAPTWVGHYQVDMEQNELTTKNFPKIFVWHQVQTKAIGPSFLIVLTAQWLPSYNCAKKTTAPVGPEWRHFNGALCNWEEHNNADAPPASQSYLMGCSN